MVIGTLALLLIFLVSFYVSRAAALEGTGGDCVLFDDPQNLIEALPGVSEALKWKDHGGEVRGLQELSKGFRGLA